MPTKREGAVKKVAARPAPKPVEVEAAPAPEPKPKAVDKDAFRDMVLAVIPDGAEIVRIVAPGDPLPDTEDPDRLTIESTLSMLEARGASLVAATDAGFKVFLIGGRLIQVEGLPPGISEAELLPPRPDPSYVAPARRLVHKGDFGKVRKGSEC